MNATNKTLKDQADATLDAAHRVADDVQTKVSGLAEKASDTARAVASDLSARASDAATAVRDTAVEQMDNARDALGESGDRLAETLRRAAAEPAAGSLQSRVLSAVAGGVSTAADTLRDRSVSDIAADLRDLARRNPGVFAAGAAVAGFALARFLRASQRRDDAYIYGSARIGQTSHRPDDGRS